MPRERGECRNGVKLTEEQRTLVEEKEKLIYRCCNKCNIAVDDFYGELAIGLCYAVIDWTKQPEENPKYKLSTFAWYQFKNMTAEVFRNKKRLMFKNSVLSLDYEYSADGRENGNALLYDSISDYRACDFIDDIVFMESFRPILDKIQTKQKKRKRVSVWNKAFELLLNGDTQCEIAKEIGVTQPQVSRIIKRLSEEYKKDKCQEEISDLRREK